MQSTFAMTLTAGATLTAFLIASTAPSYAQAPPAAQAQATPPGASVSVDANPGQVQGQILVNPPGGPPGAPTYQSYPQGYPQGYPQAYPPPPPGAYPPGYAPTYPQGYYPPAYLQPRQRTPIRYEMKPLYNLIIAGSIVLGASYLTTAGIAGYVNALNCSGKVSCSGLYWPWYVPVVGPFIYFGVANSQDAALFSPLLILSGLAQAGGLAMLIAGSVARHRVPVYADEPLRVTVAPYLTPTSAGLQALATF
jgi:hypothetical protein